MSAHFNILQAASRNALFKIVAVIFIIATIGFSTVDNYGLSWDEPIGLLQVKWNIALLTKGKPIPKPDYLKYDGVIFNLASELIFQKNI